MKKIIIIIPAVLGIVLLGIFIFTRQRNDTALVPRETTPDASLEQFINREPLNIQSEEDAGETNKGNAQIFDSSNLPPYVVD
jgi:hypothetical protein